jgi:hypothetical protein
MNQVGPSESIYIPKSPHRKDVRKQSTNNQEVSGEMAGIIDPTDSNEVKSVAEVEITGRPSSVEDGKKSTWQMVTQYRPAITWAAFMGLGAINWGMDVLVSVKRLVHCIKV